jgi:hypothetical protein
VASGLLACTRAGACRRSKPCGVCTARSRSRSTTRPVLIGDRVDHRHHRHGNVGSGQHGVDHRSEQRVRGQRTGAVVDDHDGHVGGQRTDNPALTDSDRVAPPATTRSTPGSTSVVRVVGGTTRTTPSDTDRADFDRPVDHPSPQRVARTAWPLRTGCPTRRPRPRSPVQVDPRRTWPPR